ncbi:hypothetical protein NPIL_397061 [Nephila pilipes]|uniref:Uncharacterized protein n=1 Tax=Nephila pilipes TaxID=299642 RepID=A0A8X6MSX4_NEPPI|nr:hypothetical protein NPIL_397061 [Nephila pilipes]
MVCGLTLTQLSELMVALCWPVKSPIYCLQLSLSDLSYSVVLMLKLHLLRPLRILSDIFGCLVLDALSIHCPQRSYFFVTTPQQHFVWVGSLDNGQLLISLPRSTAKEQQILYSGQSHPQMVGLFCNVLQWHGIPAVLGCIERLHMF